jgi:VWFA-related protein
MTRELKLGKGGSLAIVNRFGRVAVRAVAVADDKATVGKLTAASVVGVVEKEIKTSNSGGQTMVTVAASDPKKRIDLTLELPARTNLRVETDEGTIEISGNFASVEAMTGTGTIAVDVPPDDLQYQFLWTESKPRYLSNFELAVVKEKPGGKFEMKGRYLAGAQVKSQKSKDKNKKQDPDDGTGSDQSGKEKTDAVAAVADNPDPGKKDEVPKSVSLRLTTALGIILVNVPPNEVMSDLRERPLTDAAKAIIRSGDSLLMEAIRRASPKYFGDYARTLPPMMREPSFAPRESNALGPPASLKTALVRVTDLQNRAISDLEARDFDVIENGKSREIVSVGRSTAPINLVLLLDVSGSVENYVNFIRKAARNFVDTVDPKDRVSIVIFNDDVKVLSKFTTDKRKLSESLDTFDAGGATAFYDALAFTISDTLRPLKGERTAIVILTDGDDNRSFLAFDSLIGSIQESGALIYPLYVPSALIAEASANPNADIDPVRRKYMSLTAKAAGEGDRLAKISGGVYYPIDRISQIQQAYEDIVRQLRTAYNITFRSDTNIGNGVSPRLKIRSKRENTFATVTAIAPAPTN